MRDWSGSPGREAGLGVAGQSGSTGRMRGSGSSAPRSGDLVRELQAQCPEAHTRRADPEFGASLPAGGTSGVRIVRVAQVAGAPLSEYSPLPPWCGASHACTLPWKFTSEVAWGRSGGLAVTHGPCACHGSPPPARVPFLRFYRGLFPSLLV